MDVHNATVSPHDATSNILSLTHNIEKDVYHYGHSEYFVCINVVFFCFVLLVFFRAVPSNLAPCLSVFPS